MDDVIKIQIYLTNEVRDSLAQKAKTSGALSLSEYCRAVLAKAAIEV